MHTYVHSLLFDSNYLALKGRGSGLWMEDQNVLREPCAAARSSHPQWATKRQQTPWYAYVLFLEAHNLLDHKSQPNLFVGL